MDRGVPVEASGTSKVDHSQFWFHYWIHCTHCVAHHHAPLNSRTMGRVTEAVPDESGLSKEVKIKTRTSCLDRLVMKLCLFWKLGGHDGYFWSLLTWLTLNKTLLVVVKITPNWPRKACRLWSDGHWNRMFLSFSHVFIIIFISSLLFSVDCLQFCDHIYAEHVATERYFSVRVCNKRP